LLRWRLRPSNSTSCCSKGCIIWPECIADPRDGHLLRSFHRYNIETHSVGCELPVPGNVHSCRTDDFALFAGIDSLACRNKFRGRAITHFDECQAFAIEHYQVDFTSATTEVAGYRSQSPRDEKVERLLLRDTAYNSCGLERHGASSAASGISSSPSLLMS